MGEFLDQIPEKVHNHIKSITKSSGLPDTEESIEKIAEAWIQKDKIFEEQTGNMNMEEVDSLDKDDSRGLLAITYSGSLVNIGPLVDNVRKAGYTSIELRADVPNLVSKDNSKLANDVELDESIQFEDGPVKRTSPIYRIAVCIEDLSAEEEEEKLAETTMIIMDDFIEVNKTIIDE